MDKLGYYFAAAVVLIAIATADVACGHDPTNNAVGTYAIGDGAIIDTRTGKIVATKQTIHDRFGTRSTWSYVAVRRPAPYVPNPCVPSKQPEPIGEGILTPFAPAVGSLPSDPEELKRMWEAAQ